MKLSSPARSANYFSLKNQIVCTSTWLGTNETGRIKGIPFMLSTVEAFPDFFSED